MQAVRTGSGNQMKLCFMLMKALHAISQGIIRVITTITVFVFSGLLFGFLQDCTSVKTGLTDSLVSIMRNTKDETKLFIMLFQVLNGN